MTKIIKNIQYGSNGEKIIEFNENVPFNWQQFNSEVNSYEK